MEVSNFHGLLGLAMLLVVQLGHLFKSLSNDKVIKTEINNLVEQVRRQNGNISKFQDWQLHHTESHSEKSK